MNYNKVVLPKGRLGFSGVNVFYVCDFCQLQEPFGS